MKPLGSFGRGSPLCAFAETSGKNSVLISAAADPDQAIKDLVKSSFGHVDKVLGRFSRNSEADLYDDTAFQVATGCCASLWVGPRMISQHCYPGNTSSGEACRED